jgi:hypothetical protein
MHPATAYHREVIRRLRRLCGDFTDELGLVIVSCITNFSVTYADGFVINYPDDPIRAIGIVDAATIAASLDPKRRDGEWWQGVYLAADKTNTNWLTAHSQMLGNWAMQSGVSTVGYGLGRVASAAITPSL